MVYSDLNILTNLRKKYDLVLGCGFGIVEYLLPDYIYCLSYDVDEKAYTRWISITYSAKSKSSYKSSEEIDRFTLGIHV
jgi:hypothetical protein